MINVKRTLSWYLADGEDFIDEIIIDIPLKILQDIFSIDSSNPMYDCYTVDKNISEILNQYFEHNYDFDKFDYRIEATAL